MKRILIIATLIILSLQTMAQRGGEPNWISIAGKVGFGSTLMFCEDVKNDDNAKQIYFSPALSVGGRLGVVFKDRVGVSVEYLSSDYQHKYEFTAPGDAKARNTNLRIKASDLLVLARYTGEYGFYAELGPKITFVKSIECTEAAQTYTQTDCFKSKYNSIVFGFGFSPYNGERIIVSLGLRAAYCSKDIVLKPVPEGGFSGTGFTQYPNLQMNPFSAQVMIDINYHFARFGSATCGKQKIIFFK
jgi:hypothetical protein